MSKIPFACACLMMVACGSNPVGPPDDASAQPDGDASVVTDGPPVTDGKATDSPIDSPASGTMTFDSPATCGTTPCQHGKAPNATGVNPCTVGAIGTNVVGLGNVNNGVADECRIYGFYKPANLVGTATAVFVAGGSGQACPNAFDGSNWWPVADANRLVIISLNYCPRSQWYHPAVDVPDPGPSAASDAPYLAAVIQDAVTRLGIDPHRLILTGGSSGGVLTWSTACDPAASTLFRGYAPVSALMQLQASGTAAVDNTERCASTNKDVFIDFVLGTADPSAPYGLPEKCVTQGTPHCFASFAENERYWSTRLGCSATPSHTMFGNTNKNAKDDYSGCGFGSPPDQFEGVTVTNGGHQWPGLDQSSSVSTDGFNTAQANWAYFSKRTW